MSEELNDSIISQSISKDGIEVRGVQFDGVINLSVIFTVTNWSEDRPRSRRKRRRFGDKQEQQQKQIQYQNYELVIHGRLREVFGDWISFRETVKVISVFSVFFFFCLFVFSFASVKPVELVISGKRGSKFDGLVNNKLLL